MRPERPVVRRDRYPPQRADAARAPLVFSGRPVEVDPLVGAGGHAHASAAALMLVYEDDTVLLALVDLGFVVLSPPSAIGRSGFAEFRMPADAAASARLEYHSAPAEM